MVKFSEYDGIAIAEEDLSEDFWDANSPPASGVNLEEDTFKKIICRNCGEDSFEIYYTDSYETSARCLNCDEFFTVHSG